MHTHELTALTTAGLSNAVNDPPTPKLSYCDSSFHIRPSAGSFCCQQRYIYRAVRGDRINAAMFVFARFRNCEHFLTERRFRDRSSRLLILELLVRREGNVSHCGNVILFSRCAIIPRNSCYHNQRQALRFHTFGSPDMHQS